MDAGDHKQTGDSVSREERSLRANTFLFAIVFLVVSPMAIVNIVCLCDYIFHFLPQQDALSDSHWPLNTDFVSLWSAARLTLENKTALLFDAEKFFEAHLAYVDVRPLYKFYWPYPPHMLPLIAGFGFIPYRLAFVVWSALTFALYAFSLAYKRPCPWLLTLALALAPASFDTFFFGQNGFLAAACLVGGLRLRDKHPALSGVAFGLMTFKPQLMLMVPFVLLLEKRGRVIGFALLTALAFAGISLALWGTEPWIAYVQNAIPHQTFMFELPSSVDNHLMNASYVTFFSAVRRLGGGLSLAYGLSALAAFVAACATLFACLRVSSPALRDMLILTASFLATPYAHHYDMPVLMAAVVSFFVADKTKPVSTVDGVLLFAVCVLPFFVSSLNLNGVPLAPLFVLGLLIAGLRAAHALDFSVKRTFRFSL